MDAQYNDQINEAIKVVETKEDKTANEITLSSGVVLRLKRINVLRINAVVEQFKYPEVPTVWDEHKEREIKNPDSPVYKQMIEETDTKRMWAVLDAIAALGTEVVSVPDGVPDLDDDVWVEELRLLNIPVETSGLARYMAWIKFVAIVDARDFQVIAEQFGVAMGTSEGKVAEAINRNFPG